VLFSAQVMSTFEGVQRAFLGFYTKRQGGSQNEFITDVIKTIVMEHSLGVTSLVVTRAFISPQLHSRMRCRLNGSLRLSLCAGDNAANLYEVLSFEPMSNVKNYYLSLKSRKLILSKLK